MNASERITSHIDSLADWQGTLLGRLRQIIRASGPDLVEEWEFDAPVQRRPGGQGYPRCRRP